MATPTPPGVTWEQLARYARRAPSPHNTQPARLRVLDPERAEVWFVRERGLPTGDPQGRFTHLTFGIFVEILRIAARGAGHDLRVDYAHPPLYADGAPLCKVADLRLVRPRQPVADLDPELVLRRRTNRHPYDRRPVPEPVVRELEEEAGRHGHRLRTATDPRAVRWVKELNRDALFHDLAHDDYRSELDGWLRYSRREARRRRDGLSPECLVLPGLLLRAFMRSHRLLTAPLVEPLVQTVYLRTMRGISTVAWLQGDFASVQDWTRAGHLMIRLWLILTRHGIDWQPYGSVITNEPARRSMTERFGIEEGPDGRDMVWLLARMGFSQHEPARSHRLPLEEVLR